MKLRLVLALLLSVFVFQFCTSTKKAVSAATITYQKDILPIMQARCTPCHFPEQGKKKFLDTYAATRDNIEDILFRVQLPVTDQKFMPFKSKKAPLSDSLIMVIKEWKLKGMREG